MKVIAYIRVSTDGQVGDDKFGLDSQRETIEEYCAGAGMEIVQWFADEGESGAKERPGFDRIVYSDLSELGCEAVIVAKSDRVARDINVYFYYKMMLQKKGLKLISIAEDFGSFGVFAPMLEAFTLCVAEMERANITKRTSGGRKVKAERGGYSGGKAPFGYEIEGGALRVKEAEAEAVRAIYALRENGVGLCDIAATLEKRGYRARGGGRFAVSTISNILKNKRTYEGWYRYGGSDWVKGAQEAIL